MESNKLTAFIISHGRPDNVFTYNTLRKHGYTGEIYIIIDNLDKTAEKYIANYGTENIVVFDKPAIARTFDIGDNFDGHRSTSYARNACFDIAENLGIKYFIVLDDDYVDFQYKFSDKLEYQYNQIWNLDTVFSALLKFFISSGVHSIALAQGGDFIGGDQSNKAQFVSLYRKCMNSFICSIDRRFQFISRLNEDVNTYIKLGSIGYIFFTTNHVSLNQKQTQATAGGMTEAYQQNGTYVKSFYSVMYMPSCAKIRMMNTSNRRIHHAIKWNNTVPVILDEKWKK